MASTNQRNKNCASRRKKTVIDIKLKNGEYLVHDRTSISEILTQFMCFSSIRGVSRIVISKGRGFRIMWSIAVICLIAMAITHVTYLVMIFCKRNTRFIISTISEEEIPFPTFTICFSSLLPNHGIQYLRNRDKPFNLTPFEYRNRILEMKKETHFSVKNKNSVTGILLNSIGYFENVPDETRTHINYLQNMTIASNSCHVFYQSEFNIMRRGDCQINPIEIPGFFGCFQIRPPENTQYKAHEIEFFVRLDQYDYLNCWQCIPESMRTARNGIVGKIHPPGILPLMNFKEELHLYPGTSNTITVSFNKYNRMCISKVPENMSYYLFGKSVTYSYWTEFCISNALIQNIFQQCGCTLKSFSFRNISQPLCLQQNLTAKSLNLTFLNCLLKLPLAYEFQGPYKKIVLPRETSQCPRPCEYIDYAPSLKAEQLIGRHAQLIAYEQIILNNKNMPHDENFDKILKIRESGTLHEKQEAIKYLQSKNSLIEKVLHIKIIRLSSSAPLLHTEVYIMDVFQIVGQVGGALSVWAGITFVCIVEFLELFYNIISLHLKKRYHIKQAVETGNQPNELLLS